jgi:hypothetical protein
MTRGQQRQSYDAVASTDASAAVHEEDEEDLDLQEVPITEATSIATGTGEGSEAPSRTNSRITRRQYSRVSATTDDEDKSLADTASAVTLNSEHDKDEDDIDEEDDDGTRITVTILDFAQKKFNVSMNPSWTVKKFKATGEKIHKVASAQQRLIYRGKLLVDNQTLSEAGIKDDGVIVHLFPKPRVVIHNSNNNVDNSADASDNSEEQGGARVPTIVMDADEAERRSSILVLGSQDFLEAQNSIKLFSFMLLMISSIELLNLLAIGLGVPQDANMEGMETGIPMNTEDDIFAPPPSDDFATLTPTPSPGSDTDSSSTGMQYQQWDWADSVDLFISILGVYVALLGIKASSENTLRLARQYLWGTAFVGVSWWFYNYYMTVQIDETIEAEREERDDDLFPPMSNKDIYSQALSVMVLPGMLWVLCCFRAFQFHFLLHEAEEEAAARMLRDADPEQQASSPDTTAAANEATVVAHDEELTLQNGSASMV